MFSLLLKKPLVRWIKYLLLLLFFSACSQLGTGITPPVPLTDCPQLQFPSPMLSLIGFLDPKGYELNKILIEWEGVPEAHGYNLYYSQYPNTTENAFIIENVSNPYIFDGPIEFEHYSFRVTAFNDTCETLNALENDIKGINGVPSIQYKKLELEDFGFDPIVGDITGDGCLDVMGAFNDGFGGFIPKTADSLGMGIIIENGRFNNGNSIADFNGDGFLDYLSTAYGPFEDDRNIARLFFNDGNGGFQESLEFFNLNIRGFAEPSVVADFDNDNDLDIFIPYYSHNNPSEQSYLLINDGVGNFENISDAAGVSLRGIPHELKVEGSQAGDINFDGFIDFYVGSHLFINNGDLTFTDVREEVGLPEIFDEGFNFIDWNNDGFLDLVIFVPGTGPLLFENNGTIFEFKDVVPRLSYGPWGMNVFDLNNDGWIDILPSGNNEGETFVLLNDSSKFIIANDTPLSQGVHSSHSFGDFNRDGKIDSTKREFLNEPTKLNIFENTSNLNKNFHFYLELVGPNGEKNQHGRVVKIHPESDPKFIMTRIVDTGSGYKNQNQYALLIGTPFDEPHHVSVYFSDKIVEFEILPGENKRVFWDGTVNEFSWDCPI